MSLSDLGLEDVAIAHVRVAGNVNGRNPVIGGARGAGNSQRLQKSTVNVLSFLGPVIISVPEPEIVDQCGPKNRREPECEVPSRVVVVVPNPGGAEGLLAKESGTKRKQLLLIKQEKPPKELVFGRQFLVDSRHGLVRRDAAQPDVDVVVRAGRALALIAAKEFDARIARESGSICEAGTAFPWNGWPLAGSIIAGNALPVSGLMPLKSPWRRAAVGSKVVLVTL